MTHPCCPTCGQAWPENTVRVEHDANIVVIHGKALKLWPSQIDILDTLIKARGRPVCSDTLLGRHAISPLGLRSNLSRMRKKLAPLGVTIEHASRDGVYRLRIVAPVA